MYRRVVLSRSQTGGSPVAVLYHVCGARVLSQSRISTIAYDKNFTNSPEIGSAVFPDALRLQVDASIGGHRVYEFILYVPDNQPAKEAVEEITSTGVAIAVYNEHGVLVCHNGVGISTESSPSQTVVHGETTSEPIVSTDEMTSEPIDASGGTTNVTAEETSQMI